MMQQRVGEFLSQVAADSVTLILIQLNDKLNSAFQSYVLVLWLWGQLVALCWREDTLQPSQVRSGR